jgi:hypothetical protein
MADAIYRTEPSVGSREPHGLAAADTIVRFAFTSLPVRIELS